VKVFWTEAALSQLQAINDYISHTSPEYALRMIDRLTKRSVQIAEFPYSGRMVPEYESNEIREVLEWPYRLIYLINAEQSQS
jgi:toxin ParE1/3/4